MFSNWFELRNFIDISTLKKKGTVQILLTNESDLQYSPPVFFSDKISPALITKHEGPERFVLCFYKGQVIGESSLILTANHGLFYELKQNDHNKKFWYTDEPLRLYSESFGIIGKEYESEIEIPEAIFMGGNFSSNYFHFLFEILPRFELINRAGISTDIPLLVDKIVMEVDQYHDLLTVFNDANRKIIVMDKGKRYRIGKLFYSSNLNFIPPNFLNVNEIAPMDVLFDFQSLDFLRNILLPLNSKSVFTERIFLSRNLASDRRQFNEEEIFNFLEPYGFVKLSPEKYSIADQIAMFNQAKFIIGGSGAAFSNLLFCNPDCRVIILSKYSIPFSGFSTIAGYLDVKLTYLIENDDGIANNSTFHTSFNINIERLRILLNEMLISS
jgi:capsular polysaccharide biosynthesis protein